MKKAIPLLLAFLLAAAVSGCSGGGDVKLDPANPVTVTIWHYYNGAVLRAFEQQIDEFNETVGAEQGIIVEHSGLGGVAELEQSVMSAANKEIGSPELPNIFNAYADQAFKAEQLGLLSDLGAYVTDAELAEYRPSFIQEGRIGSNGELMIFPIAKSTEIFTINETDWQPFADELGLGYDSLATMEGVAEVSELYYNWTDERNGDEPGQAFFGRDGLANLFITASKDFGTDVFSVSDGKVTINVDTEVVRKIWDYYYVPYVNGYYASYGKFRSDDAKVGDILAYVGSISSASYFPLEVTKDSVTYPVEGKALPAPGFEGGAGTMIQQGAGMVVVKKTPEEEYASMVFLKWFTQDKQNIAFAAQAGYLPVKTASMDYELIKTEAASAGIEFGDIVDQTLKIALDEVQDHELYTNMAFHGGIEARAILENDLQDKAAADRASVLELIASGTPHDEAVAVYANDAAFRAWLGSLTQKLNEAALTEYDGNGVRLIF